MAQNVEIAGSMGWIVESLNVGMQAIPLTDGHVLGKEIVVQNRSSYTILMGNAINQEHEIVPGGSFTVSLGDAAFVFVKAVPTQTDPAPSALVAWSVRL